MRFPWKQTLSIARNVYRKKRSDTDRFPLVMMLEPLFTCDLRCTGCGRIREYGDVLGKMLSVDDCLKAAAECDAPVVSICGGEPLIYPYIGELTSGLLAQGRVVYLCTNGQKLADSITKFHPHDMFNFNVHLDGLEKSHDTLTGKNGSFTKAVDGIRAAKNAGFNVCTNTTVYAQSEPNELKDLIAFLSKEVDGILLSPGFDYEDVLEKDFFLSREDIVSKFKAIETEVRGQKIWNTPRFIDFLTGKRYYNCTPWGSVTYNVKGWKSPCYLITDKHYPTYSDFINLTDWSRYGPAQDKRCSNCMAHCGFEVTTAYEASNSLKEGLRYLIWLIWK